MLELCSVFGLRYCRAQPAASSAIPPSARGSANSCSASGSVSATVVFPPFWPPLASSRSPVAPPLLPDFPASHSGVRLSGFIGRSGFLPFFSHFSAVSHDSHASYLCHPCRTATTFSPICSVFPLPPPLRSLLFLDSFTIRVSLPFCVHFPRFSVLSFLLFLASLPP